MTTIQDEYDKFTAKCGDAGNKIIGFAIIGCNLNLLREGAEELHDEEILDSFDSLIELLAKKSDELFKTEIEKE